MGLRLSAKGLKEPLFQKRADYDRARRLTEKQKQLLLGIRGEYPSLSSLMGIKNMARSGVLEPEEHRLSRSSCVLRDPNPRYGACPRSGEPGSSHP